MHMILKNTSIIFLLVLFSTLHAQKSTKSEQWKPVEAPLMTPWAGKVDPGNVLPEYPRPVMVRERWQNLNGVWEFQQAQEGDKVPINEKLSDNILVPFPWESALSGVRKQFESNRAWYRRTFKIDDNWDGNNVLLHFGAVDWEAIVYIDGKCVGTHKGGFDPFSFDITKYLEDIPEHEIIVGVYDPTNSEGIAYGKQNRSRFDDPQRYAYSPSSGIWQTVWLEPVPVAYINDIRIKTDIDAEELTIETAANQRYNNYKIKAIVKDGTEEIVSDTGKFLEPLTISLPNPKLWSPDSPFLYDVEIQLYDDKGVLIDKVDSYFGMRKIALASGKHGMKFIHLNNKFLFQMGTLDQGYWPDGIYTAPTDEALKWDIEKTKEFGYNMIRKHIKIEPQRWYYWCDKLGILVWQDMPSTFAYRNQEDKAQFEWELTRMVQTHWNHPSIITWIVFNEHWGLYDPVRLTENVMGMDNTRLVTGNSGIDAGKPNLDFEVGHIIDNHSYRPPNVPFATQKRASVCGEYGAIGYNVKGHIWDKDGPWVHYNYKGKDAATEEYEKFIKQIIKFKKNGLCAAVYTQWTDVENEMNGIYTYDRKVIKHHKERIIKANESTWKTQ
ncbi:MAG: glycoside hydrolase family 2 [Bacteroidales bacterium]|nr:glycoside hydrolase family 2 [Bacteroidales bacterium]